MKLTLACKDLGLNCDYVAHGEFFFELMTDEERHGKDIHGFTEEDIHSPEMTEKIKAAVKQK